MKDFAKDSKHLQKLSCITLTPAEEEKLNTQLGKIVEMLDKLPMVDEITSWSKQEKMTLRTLSGIKDEEDSASLLQNAHHEKINNSLVIKSVLS